MDEEPPHASPEALVVLLLEMLVFLGACLGSQAAVRNSDDQPALVSTALVGLFLCTGVMMLATAINSFLPEFHGIVFVLSRAAWHFALASSINAKAFAVLVVTGQGTHQRQWSMLLLQTQTHAMENRFFTATQNAWVLAIVSVVVLMQTVFYNKVSHGALENRNVVVGRFTTMLAFSALLVQYTVEMELGRACDVGAPGTDGRPLEIKSCELENIIEPLAAQYTLMRPICAILAVLLLTDVLLCVVYAKLQKLTQHRQYAHNYLLLLIYALVALVPCTGYTIVVAVLLPYTTDAHLGYLIGVGSLLALSSARRVWDSFKSLKDQRSGILEADPDIPTADVMNVVEGRFRRVFRDESEALLSEGPYMSHAKRETHASMKGARFGAILRGTSQSGTRNGETKKGI